MFLERQGQPAPYLVLSSATAQPDLQSTAFTISSLSGNTLRSSAPSRDQLLMHQHQLDQNVDAPAYIVLGANGGIGSDLCRRLRKRGAKILLAGRNKEELEHIADELSMPFHICDATDFDSVQSSITQAQSHFGTIDGIANCVGSILLKPAHLTSPDDWARVIATNLTSAFATVKSASKAMMQKGGSIVLVSSCAARYGLPNHEAIAAAKAGIEGLVKSAAATYSRQSVRVNCVAPGLVDTKLTKSITSNELQLKASVDMHPLGKIGTPQDVSIVIDWLLSDQSGWVTGQTIAVDGGLSTVKSLRVQK